MKQTSSKEVSYLFIIIIFKFCQNLITIRDIVENIFTVEIAFYYFEQESKIFKVFFKIESSKVSKLFET